MTTLWRQSCLLDSATAMTRRRKLWASSCCALFLLIYLHSAVSGTGRSWASWDTITHFERSMVDIA